MRVVTQPEAAKSAIDKFFIQSMTFQGHLKSSMMANTLCLVMLLARLGMYTCIDKLLLNSYLQHS
jgi:hypothetical protein